VADGETAHSLLVFRVQWEDANDHERMRWVCDEDVHIFDFVVLYLSTSTTSTITSSTATQETATATPAISDPHPKVSFQIPGSIAPHVFDLLFHRALDPPTSIALLHSVTFAWIHYRYSKGRACCLDLLINIDSLYFSFGDFTLLQ
jgi:hypothetical protein